MKKSLEPVVKDPLEQKFLMYFDIMSWLESKISKQSFHSVVLKNLPKIKVLVKKECSFRGSIANSIEMINLVMFRIKSKLVYDFERPFFFNFIFSYT